MDFLTNLNPAQHEAVTHTHGPLLIIAGAGSGKTRVITSRIAHLLRDHQVPASAIVALTFTNKAAHEMKERIAQLLGHEQIAAPFVGTFHAYCVRLLKQFSALRSTPFNGILDTDDQEKIIKKILAQHGLQKQISLSQVVHQISQLKNRTHDRDRFLEERTNQLFAEIYHEYEQEKKLSQCLDFDDLLLETVALFDNQHFTQQMHTQIRHVLIDEYQDTNSVQHTLLKKLCIRSDRSLTVDSVCAVGDEDQSIYSWRGATVTNMRSFTHDFAHTHIVKIEQNYRSAQQILDVANAVIVNNPNRTPKKLWSHKKGNNRVYSVIFSSEYQEADALAQLAQMLVEHKRTDSCALLYRTHTQSRILEEALVKRTIPYRIIGGTQFYDRMEVRDLLAYLKLIANPFDRVSCARILNTPTRGIGTKTEEELFDCWNQHPTMSFHEIITMFCSHQQTVRSLAFSKFISIFDTLSAQSSPSTTLTAILKKTEYISYLQNSYDKEEATERCANVDELINAALHAESVGIHTVSGFLESIALMQEHIAQSSTEQNHLLLMTLHAARGLEFDTVILAGLEEEMLPSARSINNPESLEEERRLLYVGITRARERLLFTYCRTRHIYGKLMSRIPSRFIKELPAHSVPTHDASMWRAPMLRAFLSQWLNLSTITPIVATAKIAPQHNSVAAPAPSAAQKSWHMHQPVKHASFGIGIIKDIEHKGTQTIITAQFRAGTKKIISDFLTSL